MTDDEVLALKPDLQAFVDAVNDRDRATGHRALAEIPQAVLAVFAAGWAGELLDELKAVRAENTMLLRAMKVTEARANKLRADLAGAHEDRAHQANKLARYREKIYALGGKP